jgi:hypothetical protein
MAAGDFDNALPLFKMYGDMLQLSLRRSEIYFGHPGVYFPETSYFFGGYTSNALPINYVYLQISIMVAIGI